MDTAAGPKLLQQAEKILLHPIHPHLVSYCPTMDLIALVTDEENLDVYRINGQRAFGLKRKSEDETVDAVAWQGNGANVAVAWSGGSVDVVSCETGKVVHRDVRLGKDAASMDDDDDERRTIKCLGWGLNFIDAESVKRRTGEAVLSKDGASNEPGATPGSTTKKRVSTTPVAKTIDFNAPTTDNWDVLRDDTTLEDFLQRQPDFEALDIAPDLPDQLAMMDMETLLPKLPPIPLPPANPFMMMRGAQADAGAFSTQAQVDGLLHSHHLRDHNSVDMFLRCTSDGTIHPSIYDSMETVDIHLPKAWGVQSSPIMHASHPYACTHAFLMSISNPQTEQKQIAFVPLALGFIPSAGIYLHLIASKTAQLQNLLSYLTQSLSRIRAYFTHSQDLPSKFMRNISDTLAENNEGGLVQNLYHLACTGHCPPLIHEWLVDELAEQGHKRWDNAVASNLAIVIQLLHENFLPALDRCSIIISRLRGLAAFYEDQDWIFTGPLTEFTALLDLLKTLRLLAHTTLLYATDERRQFGSFSKWLRYEIDFEATEPESQSRAEMEARDSGVDISVVLEYIQYGMSTSDIGPFLTAAKDVPPSSEHATFYDAARKSIELLRTAAPYKAEALCLDTVLARFGTGVHSLLKQVSAWQENNISMDCGLVLQVADAGDALDMRMLYEPTSSVPNAISTYIALCTPSPSSTLYIHRLLHAARLTALPASLHTHAISALSIPAYTILDAKFADNTMLLILVQAHDTPKSQSQQQQQKISSLLCIPYTSSPAPSSPAASVDPSSAPAAHETPLLRYSSVPAESLSAHVLPTGVPVPAPGATTTLDAEGVRRYTRHVFEARFVPLRLVVNGRKGRRVVVVLGSDRKHYRVLDLDYKERRREERVDGDGDGEVEGDGDSSEWESESGSDVDMGGA